MALFDAIDVPTAWGCNDQGDGRGAKFKHVRDLLVRKREPRPFTLTLVESVSFQSGIEYRPTSTRGRRRDNEATRCRYASQARSTDAHGI